MAEALVNYGPIFIGLDADSKLFMFYKSGVLSINNCPTSSTRYGSCYGCCWLWL